MKAEELPDPISTVFRFFDNELTGLWVRWKFYRQLFRVSSLRLELLNASASNFFVHLERVLISDLVLAISRMTDPVETKGHRNMSLQHLVHAIKEFGADDLATSIGKRVDEIEALCEPFRTRRNKLIAHRDLDRVLAPKDNPLPGIKYEKLDDALKGISSLMNDIQLHFTG